MFSENCIYIVINFKYAHTFWVALWCMLNEWLSWWNARHCYKLFMSIALLLITKRLRFWQMHYSFLFINANFFIFTIKLSKSINMKNTVELMHFGRMIKLFRTIYTFSGRCVRARNVKCSWSHAEYHFDKLINL